MFTIKFWNGVLFLFIKYSVFFFILAFLDDRFKHLVLDKVSDTGELLKQTLSYALYVLFHAVFMVASLCGPFTSP